MILRNQAAASPPTWSWGWGTDLVALPLQHFFFNMAITKRNCLVQGTSVVPHPSCSDIEDSLNPSRNSEEGSDH